uniref:Fe2OG dioxygenase domain-containing protein n=1 Tax=Oryza glumipatula TaxID=40148 RepID=A0A0E0BDP2_9ORYZ
MAEVRTIGSLPVPNVQALAGTCNGSDEQIPERYIRTEATCEEVISNYHGDMAIPIIDLNKLLSPQSSEEECVKLRSACQYWGFFQLINHGVPEEVIENFRSNIIKFFSLPLDAKKEYSQLPNSLEGYGQTFVFSEDQKLDWGDMLYLQGLEILAHSPCIFQVIYQKLCNLPSDKHPLPLVNQRSLKIRQSLDQYSSETKSLSLCLFEFLAKAVGAEPESLLGIFEEQPRGMRMNYYPPCRQSDKVIGLSPHTDVVGLTLLLQVNDVQGLQIKRDGKWFSVDALSGAFIVNIGDTLEILSNGKFKSVEHRAMIHPNKERISTALFHYPRDDLLLSPLPEFVKDGKILSNGKFRSVEHRAVIYPNKERLSAALFNYARKDMMTSPLPEFVKDGKPKDELAMAEARTIGSISVPNVQELAGTCNGTDEQIPERYIRPEVSSDEVIKNNHGDMSIPIIDLDKLISPQSSQEECVKLISACQYWGFFQLINHGVPDEVTENLKNDLVEFFSQPLDAKKEYSQLPNSLEGYGQAFVVSDNQKLDWADMLYLQICPTESRDLRFWPNYPASFRHSIDAYSSATEHIGLSLMQFMAKAVGVEPKSLSSVFEGQARGLRMNYYPPCLKADKVLGLSPHTDLDGLTLLLQVNDVQGLQINKDGKWFSVNALNDALIVNIGDTLEILSNGKFRSVEHRAVVHPSRERISAALFYYPCQDLAISPLPDFVKDGKVKYKTISYQDLLIEYFTAELDGRNRLEKLKLEP